MASKGFHKSIQWFIVIILLLAMVLSVFKIDTIGLFNYGFAIALIYVVLRMPLEYAK